jgi:hypothetical protein
MLRERGGERGASASGLKIVEDFACSHFKISNSLAAASNRIRHLFLQ